MNPALWVLSLWVLVAAPVARAGEVVVATDGPLRPGRTVTLEVASVSGSGEPSPAPPVVSAEGGTLTAPASVRPGVWRYGLTPASAAGTVAVRAGDAALELPSAPPPPSSLVVERVDAVARGEPVTFTVRGDGPIPVEALEVVAGEGQVVQVVPAPAGAEITVALDDLPYPRWVPVAVRDLRKNEQPAWVGLRVRAKPRIPLAVDAGAKATVRVGGRVYGPYVADAAGWVELRVDQFPGEYTANLVLTDDLGNETRSDLPLASAPGPALLAVAGGEQLPGRPPPLVFVYGVGQDGDPLPAPPTCTSAAGPMPLTVSGETSWTAAVPPTKDAADLRVTCTAGTSVATARVPVAGGVATGLALRVWPDQLVADFAVAELSVVVDDARGERAPVVGVTVDAELGKVDVSSGDGVVLRGTYDGEAAAERGEDVVHARWVAPPGSGPVAELRVTAGRIPASAGECAVSGRALDSRRRPLAGVPILLRAGDASASATTGPDGWATATLHVEPRGRPIALSATSGSRWAAAALLPGELSTVPGPGEPDLSVDQRVSVRAGRVRGISIEVAPSVLRTAPGAVAWVTVRLEDGTGQPVTDEPIDLVASEGAVGELHARADGTLVAEYVPEVADVQREVEITARTATVRSTAHLVLEPRVVQLSFGPWVGGHTNFGALTGLAAGLDVDVRLRGKLIGEALVLRTAVAGIGLRSQVDTGVGPPVEVRSTLVPLSAMLVFRQDRGRFAVWAGAGGTLAPRYTQIRFGDELVDTGGGFLGGPSVAAGGGLRVPGGELVLTLQGTWLPAPADVVGYSGNLGGILGGVGYRLVY